MLLLCSLRQKRAKAVYIPHRRSGSMKQSAVITFKDQKDLENATTKPIKYNNWTLIWANEVKKREIRLKRSLNKREEVKLVKVEEGETEEIDGKEKTEVLTKKKSSNGENYKKSGTKQY